MPISIEQQLREEFNEEKARLAKLNNYSANVTDELNRRYFGRFDTLLDLCAYSPAFLSIETVAHTVANSWHYWECLRIDLIAYTVIPSHVHAVFYINWRGDRIRKDEFASAAYAFSQKLRSPQG